MGMKVDKSWTDRVLKKRANMLLPMGVGFAAAGPLSDFADIFKSKEQIIQKHIEDIAKPKHEAELRTINVQGLLYDLTNNDPIISSYPLETILNGYNELSEIAPMSMQQHAIAKILLRKWLAQGGVIDPFDIHQLTTIEHRLRSQLDMRYRKEPAE